MTNFADILRNMHLLRKTIYRLHKVHFIVNLLYQNLIKKYKDDLEH